MPQAKRQPLHRQDDDSSSTEEGNEVSLTKADILKIVEAVMNQFLQVMVASPKMKTRTIYTLVSVML